MLRQSLLVSSHVAIFLKHTTQLSATSSSLGLPASDARAYKCLFLRNKPAFGGFVASRIESVTVLSHKPTLTDQTRHAVQRYKTHQACQELKTTTNRRMICACPALLRSLHLCLLHVDVLRSYPTAMMQA
jgi:hypothetical protein